MALTVYLIVLLALVLYRPLKFAVLLGKPRMLHDWSDLLAVRHEQTLRLLDRYFFNRWIPPVALTLLSLVVSGSMNWSTIDPTYCLRVVIGIASTMLAWKSATLDIDLATGRRLIAERLVVVCSTVGVIAYPGFLFLLLFTATNFFRGWQHHQHLQIRILLAFLAAWIGYLTLQTFVDLPPITSAGLMLLLLVTGSQYLVPGIAKCRLGRRWYSWIWHNRLHNLSLGACMWGWCRFLPQQRVVRWICATSMFDRPFQMFVVMCEVGAAFMMFDRRLAIVILTALALFHATAFILAGLLFWQNMTLLIAQAAVFVFLPDSLSKQVFGPANGVLGCLLMFSLSFGLRLWRPFKLSWWDTPYIARTDWTVEGVSGKSYGLYNDFMEPNDRIFGNKSGHFLAHYKRLTDHAGHAAKWEVADAIERLRSAPELLAEEVERLGKNSYDAHQGAEHDRYMTAFLTNFNLGMPKRVVPRWLKAPGGQYYHWGPLPSFQGQESVKRLVMHYREEIFDGTQILTLRNELLRTIEIPGFSRARSAAEVTCQQMRPLKAAA